METPLIELKKHDIKRAARIYFKAYQEYPIWQFLIPDEMERKTKFLSLWEFFVKFYHKYGQIFANSSKFEGLVSIVHSEKMNTSLIKQLSCGGFKVIRKFGIKFLRKSIPIENYIQSERVKNAPFSHWYLSYIAVDPEYQSKGIGSIMLKKLFKKYEKYNLPFYLETHVKRNVSFYQNLNFELLKESITPGTDIQMWCMLKK